MRALGSNVRETDKPCHLRSHDGLGGFVVWNLGDDSLAWSRVRPVVDQFGRIMSIGNFLERSNLLLAAFEKEREARKVAKRCGRRTVSAYVCSDRPYDKT